MNELPRHILLVVAGVDILLHEQLTFIDYLKRHTELANGEKPRVFESIVFDKGFHGWLERKPFSLMATSHTHFRLVPSTVIGKQGVQDRAKAYSVAIEFLIDAHRGRIPTVKGSRGPQEL